MLQLSHHQALVGSNTLAPPSSIHLPSIPGQKAESGAVSTRPYLSKRLDMPPSQGGGGLGARRANSVLGLTSDSPQGAGRALTSRASIRSRGSRLTPSSLRGSSKAAASRGTTSQLPGTPGGSAAAGGGRPAALHQVGSGMAVLLLVPPQKAAGTPPHPSLPARRQ